MHSLNVLFDDISQDMTQASGLLDLLICSKGTADGGELAALQIIQEKIDLMNSKFLEALRSNSGSNLILPEGTQCGHLQGGNLTVVK